jgi:spore coat polysaccharide biosynthesis protein SpsF
MKVVAIIQARMGSTRLPGKVLADIHGRPMLRWLLDRIQSINEITEVVVATTEGIIDDELVHWLESEQVAYFRGSENDVLARFFCCAADRMADIIVRVTADDPLKDPSVVRQAISMVSGNPAVDYCSNSLNPTYPEGLDIEVFRYSALQRAHQEARLPSEREHVTPYIWKNPEKFQLRSFEFSRNLSHWRWTVDKPEDLIFMRSIFGKFRDKPLVPFTEIVEYIDKYPHISEINTDGTIRNEGYLKSISMESK